jgi:hypothetical protein
VLSARRAHTCGSQARSHYRCHPPMPPMQVRTPPRRTRVPFRAESRTGQ